MYQLYFEPGAASFAVHWMLIELGVPHTLTRVDFAKRAQKSAEYLLLNPDGVVPTLLIDGRPHSECAALLLALADRHPEAGLAPAVGSVERINYYQWTFYCANVLQPAFRRWFYPEEPAGADAVALVKNNAQAAVEKSWERVATLLGHGGPYVLGSRLTALDFYMTMLMRWSRNMPKPATHWGAIDAYAKRMRAMPSFKTVYEREGLTEWV